jgi:hypothetical protein
MADEPQTLWGLPVVITDAVPKGTAILAPLPTPLDLIIHGSWEAWIEDERKRFGVITGIETDDNQ